MTTQVPRRILLGGLLIFGLGLLDTAFAATGCSNNYVQGTYTAQITSANFTTLLAAANTAASSTGTTGVTGTTDIEVVDGLKEGDEVITGSYKVLRTLRSGSSVKIDNSAPKKEEET